MNDIRIVRLQSGEDIVADCLEDGNALLLDSPMHLIFKRGPAGGKIMVLLPWLPLELVNENIASIKTSDILTTVLPKKELIEYYMECTKMFNEQMTWGTNFNEQDEDDEERDRLLEKLLAEAIEEKKNSNIH